MLQSGIRIGKNPVPVLLKSKKQSSSNVVQRQTRTGSDARHLPWSDKGSITKATKDLVQDHQFHEKLDATAKAVRPFVPISNFFRHQDTDLLPEIPDKSI